jgi:hypothetical protein
VLKVVAFKVVNVAVGITTAPVPLGVMLISPLVFVAEIVLPSNFRLSTDAEPVPTDKAVATPVPLYTTFSDAAGPPST